MTLHFIENDVQDMADPTNTPNEENQSGDLQGYSHPNNISNRDSTQTGFIPNLPKSRA